MLPPVTPSLDLAQLSDAELVEAIKIAWQAYESIEVRKVSAWDYFRRFRALPGPGSSLTLEPTARAYHALRDIRDLTDELERRIAQRRAQRT